MKTLQPKRVKKEFNLRAKNRIGISKVLSTRFSSSVNSKFDTDVKTLLHQHFASSHFKNVLEVGVGIGRLAPFFIEHTDMFYGIDFSEGMLDEASKNLSPYKNVELIYGDAVELEFEENFFDIGIVSLVLKHNNDERAIKLINNMKRWCKKIVLIEHVAGGAGGSSIAVIRDEQWYITSFMPKKIKVYSSFKRFKDNIVFCIFDIKLTKSLKLVFIRHGQTSAMNPYLIYGQRLDIPLSPEGITQIKSLSQSINTSSGIVYTSSLRRAVESAHILSHGAMPIVKDKNLNEIDFGIYSGKDVHNYPGIFVSKYTSLLKDSQAFLEGESLEDVKKRVTLFHNDLIHSGQEKVFIVSHQWVLNCYLKLLLKTSEDFKFEQGKLTLVEIRNEKILLFKHNITRLF
ncbi:MAG: histidine phosphatase family protein [Nanoarchaeota archaeon]|nr:histidine phosphatase family protein [Nanoarchaeota archaeon]